MQSLTESLLPERPILIGSLLGLFFAYITVVAIWRISPYANGEGEADPFKTRFGQTALAGFAGIIFSDLVTKFLPTEEVLLSDVIYSYLVSFILFFFIFLVGLALINAELEGKRARLMFGESTKNVEKLKWIVQRDTFLNLIRGRNQMRTAELVREIATYHEMIENACRGACDLIKHLIRKSINDPGLDVRVSISTLSKDSDRLKYVYKDPLSYPMEFEKKSVAWFSAMLGEPRWYLKGWKDDRDKLLLNIDEESEVPSDFREALGQLFSTKIPFADFWMGRREDYDAFVMIPIPLRKRYLHVRERKGAIHISFSDADKFKQVFGKDIVERDFSKENKENLKRFSEQPLVKELEAISGTLWPLVEKYAHEKRDYGKLPLFVDQQR
ncbi:MAG: hypothetical protein ACRD88_13160 [Terriglobia bacterium]